MRVALLLLIVLLADGSSAAARRPATVDGAGLRGPVSAGDTAPPSGPNAAVSAGKPHKAAKPILASPLPENDGRCRQTCGHDYFRCLSGDYADQCPQTWTLCLADCGRGAAGLR